MKSLRLIASLSILSICAIAHAGKVVLPESCGAYDDNFDVDTTATPGKLPPVPDGKAQLVLVFKWESNFATAGSPKLRFGTDGKWLGAAVKNSYFIATIDPGKHHLCNSVQGDKKWVRDQEIAVESGKTYYYEVKFKRDVQFGAFSTVAEHMDYDLVTADDEMGTYFVKSLKVAQFKLKSKDDSRQ